MEKQAEVSYEVNADDLLAEFDQLKASGPVDYTTLEKIQASEALAFSGSTNSQEYSDDFENETTGTIVSQDDPEITRWAEHGQILLDHHQTAIQSREKISEYGRDWNSEYQALIDRPCQTPPTQRERAEELQKLMSAFASTAAQNVKDILLEDQISSAHIREGILFEIIGEDRAIQCGNELRAFSSTNELELEALHTPLAAILEFKNTKMYARATFPIGGDNTLVYGLTCSGLPRSSDKVVQKEVLRIKDHFNLRYHRYRYEKNVLQRSPAAELDSSGDEQHETVIFDEKDTENASSDDEKPVARNKVRRTRLLLGNIEVHKSQEDGDRLYVTAMEDFFPQLPECAMSGRYAIHSLPGHRYRPELIVNLCHQSALGNGDDKSGQHVIAFSKMCTQVDEVAAELDAMYGPPAHLKKTVAGKERTKTDCAKDINVVKLLHEKGVNCRYLAAVRKRSRVLGVKKLLLREMFARAVKRIGRNRVAEYKDTQPRQSGIQSSIILLLYRVLSADNTDSLWTNEIPETIKRKFGLELSKEEIEAICCSITSKKSKARQFKRRLLMELGLESLVPVEQAVERLLAQTFPPDTYSQEGEKKSSDSKPNIELTEEQYTQIESIFACTVRVKCVEHALAHCSFENKQTRLYQLLHAHRKVLGMNSSRQAPLLRRLVRLYRIWCDARPAACLVGLTRVAHTFCQLDHSMKNHVHDLLDVALAFRNIGRLEDAFRVLGPALCKQSDLLISGDSKFRLMRGVAALYQSKGELKRCVEVLDAALINAEKVALDSTQHSSKRQEAENVSAEIRLELVQALLSLGKPIQALSELEMMASWEKLHEDPVVYVSAAAAYAKGQCDLSECHIAEKVLSTLAPVAKKCLQGSQRHLLTDIFVQQGKVAMTLGRPKDALNIFGEALSHLQTFDGPRHRPLDKAKVLLDLSIALGECFMVRQKQRTLHEALYECQKSLYLPPTSSSSASSESKLLNGSSSNRVEVLLCMSEVYHEMGNNRRMKQVLERAARILQIGTHAQQWGKMLMLKTLTGLAVAYALGNEMKKRRHMLEQAAELATEMFGATQSRTCRIMVELARAYASTGEHQKRFKALELVGNAISKRSHMRYKSLHLSVLIDTAEAYESLRRFEDMKSSLESVLKHLETDPECDFDQALPVMSRLLVVLARANHHCAEYEKQPQLLDRALRLQQRWYGDAHPDLADTLQALGRAYGRLGENDLENKVLKMAWEMLRPLALEAADEYYNANDDNNESQDVDTKKESGEHSSLEASGEQVRDVKFLLQFSSLSNDLAESLGRTDKGRLALRMLKDVLVLLEEAAEVDKMTAIEQNINVEPVSSADSFQFGVGANDAQVLNNWSLHEQIARNCVVQALLFARAGQAEAERKKLERASKLERSLYGEQHPRCARTLLRLSSCFGRLGVFGPRLRCLREAESLIASRLPRNHVLATFVQTQIRECIPQGKKPFIEDFYDGLELISAELDTHSYDELSVPESANLPDAIVPPANVNGIYDEGFESDAGDGVSDFPLLDLGSIDIAKKESRKIRRERKRISFLRDVLKKQKQLHGAEHHFVALTLVQLADSCMRIGDEASCGIHMNRALALARRHQYRIQIPVGLTASLSTTLKAAAKKNTSTKDSSREHDSDTFRHRQSPHPRPASANVHRHSSRGKVSHRSHTARVSARDTGRRRTATRRPKSAHPRRSSRSPLIQRASTQSLKPRRSSMLSQKELRARIERQKLRNELLEYAYS